MSATETKVFKWMSIKMRKDSIRYEKGKLRVLSIQDRVRENRLRWIDCQDTISRI